MAVHQVITGALNRAEHSFAVGSVEGINFTACAVGCDVVILSSDFHRVQIIPGASLGKVQVTAVDCCSDTGKIAAAYDNVVRIYQPAPLSHQSSEHKLDYRWFETGKVTAHSPVSLLSWNLEGLRLLTCSLDRIQLWQHRRLNEPSQSWFSSDHPPPLHRPVSFSLEHSNGDVEPVPDTSSPWSCAWESKLFSPVRCMKFSPDGTLFATVGTDDRTVKIWYEARPDQDYIDFSFLYLHHPRAVVGFEWRKTGRYMPRHCVSNVLITWGKDNICRIWSETMFPGDGDVDPSGEMMEHNISQILRRKGDKKSLKASRLKNARIKITHRLKHLKKIRNKDKSHSVERQSDSLEVPISESKAPSESVVNLDAFTCIPAMIHFHLAASINAETDCFLVPSMESSLKSSTFSAHWLNNKELMFSLGAEKLLAEALFSDPLSSVRSTPSSDLNTQNATLPSEESNTETKGETGSAEMSVSETERAGTSPSPVSVPDSKTSSSADSWHKDLIDVRLENLLKDWAHHSDILFTIHPIDGSLLVWTVEWLDDVGRQPVVSFSSRLPSAFPLTDASSLHHNLATFNPHHPVFVDLLHHRSPNSLPSLIDYTQTQGTIFLLTNHENGSLNLWHLGVDETSSFCTVLNIAHRSRMCGHRFRINRVVCHPVLPLLLTTSHFHLTSQTMGGNIVLNPPPPNSSEVRKFNSELILWKVDPVGPLCKSGGVRELARINSSELTAFTNLAWIPAILPSSTLGSICNSPSSCFVASDGKCLRVYQAVIDGRGLLGELNFAQSPERMSLMSSSSSGDVSPVRGIPPVGPGLRAAFDIISSQSTARPGCIIQLAAISDAVQSWDHIQFLHTFHEEMLIGETPSSHSSPKPTNLINSSLVHRQDSVLDHSKSSVFDERFYVVSLEKKGNASGSLLHMWLLEIASQPPSPMKRSDATQMNAEGLSSPDEEGYYPTARKQPPSAAQLYIRSKKVSTQSLPLPEGVEVLEACPAAGHLPSANLYPACHAPYLFATSCSDDVVRFWKAHRESSDGSYSWREWKMISETQDSALELESSVLSLSSAHSSRLACAYDPTHRNADSERVSIDVAVLECESTGGTEWVREDTIMLRDIEIPRQRVRVRDYSFANLSPLEDMLTDWQTEKHSGAGLLTRIPSIPKINHDMRQVVYDHKKRLKGEPMPRQVVRIDWVSTEDGSHILTVGLGTKIFLFAPVSEDIAQKNIIMMKDSEVSKNRPILQKASSIAAMKVTRRLLRWINLRTVELESIDGLAPLPMMLSWVRDGILVVGMESEMRVYNQWRMSLKPLSKKSTSSEQKSATSAGTKKPESPERAIAHRLAVPDTVKLHISPSASVLDLTKKAKESGGSMMVTRKPVQSDNRKDGTGSESVAEIVREEGLFEASRLASPMLPQYHPKQLMELMNAGKTRRVKAILLHVLQSIHDRNLGTAQTLARQGSVKRRGSMRGTDEDAEPMGRARALSSVGVGLMGDDVPLDYEEIESIPPLPLYALLEADAGPAPNQPSNEADHALNNDVTSGNQYEDLFATSGLEDSGTADLDESPPMKVGGRERLSSVNNRNPRNLVFTARHSRLLTKFLTHLHLPGLSSVDQMHLLAVADTLSSFSPDVMDKLAMANAALNKAGTSSGVIESSMGGGYASVGSGAETVDECGLRYLMAMKQHEYLLRCLPMSQRKSLQSRGLSSAHVIWALHSETETELLNSIPGLAKGTPTWSEFRSLGIGWWLKNVATLRICLEKIAKTAFQKNSDPMDAAIYYVTMKKKNVLTHLFKSNGDKKMAEFFMQDFETEKWKKAAQKNAFVLLGKQRFAHAVAFFLLGGSLMDAVQTCITNLKDIQYALVMVRLHETDPERRGVLLRQLICREVLGCSPEDLSQDGDVMEQEETTPARASPDPFLRSMALWHLKEYARAASTLLDEVGEERLDLGLNGPRPALSDIFNFYSYLRTHPLVVRQRLDFSGVSIGSTEKFLVVAKQLSDRITPAERRLYFRAASDHFKSGCALLALDVLSRLPKRLRLVLPGSKTIESLVSEQEGGRRESNAFSNGSASHDTFNFPGSGSAAAGGGKAEDLDWGSSLISNGLSSNHPAVKEDPLELKWSDEEEDSDEETGLIMKKPSQPSELHIEDSPRKEVEDAGETPGEKDPFDTMAQQMKFIACLKILMEELATLGAGYNVEGGLLRYHLYVWLEKEVEALKVLCDYTVFVDFSDLQEEEDVEGGGVGKSSSLHEALRNDRADLNSRWDHAIRRRRWLAAHQHLLRTFASYCAIHGSQGIGLASARMELLLLMLELHQETGPNHISSPLPAAVTTFPLLSASVASFKTDVAGPIRFLATQSDDLLVSIAGQRSPPTVEVSLSQVYLYYNLGQCLSACIYESLSEVDHLPGAKSSQQGGPDILFRKRKQSTAVNQPDDDDPLEVSTIPSKWPGVPNLIAWLSRERDEESPPLLLLLVEGFVAVYLALFCYAFTSYDSRWLFRLVGHKISPQWFSDIFGGGAEKRLEMGGARKVPPRPPKPQISVPTKTNSNSTSPSVTLEKFAPVDPASIRAKFHAKLFTPTNPAQAAKPTRRANEAQGVNQRDPNTVLNWVPPNRSIVAQFSTKPPILVKEDLGLDYDSEDSCSDAESDSDTETETKETKLPEHLDPNGYAWTILRLALTRQVVCRIQEFLDLAGLEKSDLPVTCPRIHNCLRSLEQWEKKLASSLDHFPGGCPPGFLPNPTTSTGSGGESGTGPALHKYRAIVEPGNTPFESRDPSALPVQRLWLFLVRQEHLMDVFIRYIFKSKTREAGDTNMFGDATSLGPRPLPEPIRIMQREQDPIAAFAVSNCSPGWVVVSTGRELQEMDISPALQARTDWMHDQTELDIALSELKREPLKDNDDYILMDSDEKRDAFSSNVLSGRSFLCKRQVQGIRRMAAHPSLPYYISGANDGSVRLWEWGAAQPLYTPRSPGQFAKISRVNFSLHGNKFGITDRDGNLCLWQVSHGMALKKPYFSLKCHSKSASDFIFLGASSSLLATAGLGAGDSNLAIWDTLLPQGKSLVFSWPCHPEGTNCVGYLPQNQTLLSGGRHGELCLWDLRQRQLRHSFKAFDHAAVKTMAMDPAMEYLATGSENGDLKIWHVGTVPQLVYSLPGEHSARSGFSLRQVGAGQVQGVQQIFLDAQERLYSCGADCSLKLRALPALPHIG